MKDFTQAVRRFGPTARVYHECHLVCVDGSLADKGLCA